MKRILPWLMSLLTFIAGFAFGTLQGCGRQSALEAELQKTRKELQDARLTPAKERYERWIREAEQESKR